MLLYGVPTLVLLVLLIVIRWGNDLGLDLDWYFEVDTDREAVELFQQYLRFDTSYPDGNEIPAAEWLAQILEAEGIEVHLERLGERNANLWATIPGRQERPLVLHNHIDVEPVRRPDKWIRPPFSGDIELPFIYGRGAFDMKSIAIAQLMAMLEIKRSGEQPGRSLMFLATGDEERDSHLGTRRLLQQHPEWGEHFWAVYTEGGAIEARSLEVVKYWGTEFGQKRFVDIWVCDARRDRLEDLREVFHKKMLPRRLTEPVRQFLPHYAPSRDRPEGRTLLAEPDLLIDRLRTYPTDVGPTVVAPYVDAMLRSSVVAFPVEEAPGGGYRVRLILHLLPDVEVDEVWPTLVGDDLDGYTYWVEEVHPPVESSPLDHPAFQAVERTMAEARPEVEHGPLFIPYSATDARYFRQYGIASYGFSPFLILAVDAQRMKGVNERMPAGPFLDGVELYTRLVQTVLNGSSPRTGTEPASEPEAE